MWDNTYLRARYGSTRPVRFDIGRRSRVRWLSRLLHRGRTGDATFDRHFWVGRRDGSLVAPLLANVQLRAQLESCLTKGCRLWSERETANQTGAVNVLAFVFPDDETIDDAQRLLAAHALLRETLEELQRHGLALSLASEVPPARRQVP